MLIKIGVFIGLCILVSCQPYYVTYNTIGKLEKGMTPERVYEITKTEESDRVLFTMKVNGISYDVGVVKLQTGISTTTYNSGNKLPMTGSTVTNYHTNNLYLLYHNGKLRYWGMRNEYSKSDDPEIFALAPILYNYTNND